MTRAGFTRRASAISAILTAALSLAPAEAHESQTTVSEFRGTRSVYCSIDVTDGRGADLGSVTLAVHSDGLGAGVWARGAAAQASGAWFAAVVATDEVRVYGGPISSRAVSVDDESGSVVLPLGRETASIALEVLDPRAPRVFVTASQFGTFGDDDHGHRWTLGADLAGAASVSATGRLGDFELVSHDCWIARDSSFSLRADVPPDGGS